MEDNIRKGCSDQRRQEGKENLEGFVADLEGEEQQNEHDVTHREYQYITHGRISFRLNYRRHATIPFRPDEQLLPIFTSILPYNYYSEII